MKIAMHYPIAIWFFIVILLMQLGCAYQPLPFLPPPPSEEVRAKIGTIGVVSARFNPEAEFQTPAKGRVSGAGRGAARGAAMGALGGAAIGALCLVMAPICMPVGAVVGGTIGAPIGTVYGATTALPAKTVEEAEVALKNALSDLKIQETMRDHVFQAAHQTHYHFVLLADPGPTAIHPLGSSLITTGIIPEEVNYGLLSERGIDTVLEVSVTTVGLGEFVRTNRCVTAHPWGVNVPVAQCVSAHARLIRIADGTVLYSHAFVYISEGRKFAEWASNNAQLFREEFDRGYQNLAGQIVDQLFLARQNKSPNLFERLFKPSEKR